MSYKILQVCDSSFILLLLIIIIILFIRLGIRKKFFTVRMVRHGNRLLKEAVNAASLDTFKARLDGALSSLF